MIRSFSQTDVSIFSTKDISNTWPKQLPWERLKGDSRPVNDENARALLLASLVFVDKVILFDTDTPRDLIDFVQPDVLVKGGDYKPEEIVGYDIVKAKGGEIVTLDFVEGYSTTSLIEKMK